MNRFGSRPFFHGNNSENFPKINFDFILHDKHDMAFYTDLMIVDNSKSSGFESQEKNVPSSLSSPFFKLINFFYQNR
jgi:hypothetical protein